MKTLRFIPLASFIALAAFVSCKADSLSDMTAPPDQTTNLTATAATGTSQIQQQSSGEARISSATACNSYNIALESKTLVDGNWEWIWSVQNLNPGNGTNGTVQNLSHWGMQFGTCFSWSSVVGAAYSSDGINWINFTPVYAVDPSQSCLTTPVLKFDFGTTGGSASYYKLVLNEDYSIGSSFGYYKSGSRTGCCTFNFPGVDCTVLPPDIR